MEDREVLFMRYIDRRTMFKRVVNGAGVPYSSILVDGVEYYSIPTGELYNDEEGTLSENEKAMFIRFIENRLEGFDD